MSEPQLITDTDLASAVRQAAIARWPNEACGFVIRQGRKSLAIEVPNSAAQPTSYFLIQPQHYMDAMAQGEIIGIWHTHAECPAVPSMADLAGCEATAKPWYLMSCHKRDDGFDLSELVRFEPCGYQAPYLGRPYAFGSLDCWSLVRDYYLREFGIQLREYPRIENFWKVGHDLFGDNWEAEGFQLVPRGQEPLVGDLFLFQTDNSGKPNHIAVYTGDGRILHHARGRLSSSDPYEGYWQKHTVRHIRWRDPLEKK